MIIGDKRWIEQNSPKTRFLNNKRWDSKNIFGVNFVVGKLVS